jgi:hypothetical protein
MIIRCFNHPNQTIFQFWSWKYWWTQYVALIMWSVNDFVWIWIHLISSLLQWSNCILRSTNWSMLTISCILTCFDWNCDWDWNWNDSWLLIPGWHWRFNNSVHEKIQDHKHGQKFIEVTYLQDPNKWISIVNIKEKHCHSEAIISVRVPSNAGSTFYFRFLHKLYQHSQYLKSMTTVHVILTSCQFPSLVASIFDF